MINWDQYYQVQGASASASASASAATEKPLPWRCIPPEAIDGIAYRYSPHTNVWSYAVVVL